MKQITNEIGYDGGAFFSPDGKKIVFRASRFSTEESKKEYMDYKSKSPFRVEVKTILSPLGETVASAS